MRSSVPTLCRVNVSINLEDVSVHIEESGRPDSLLSAIEDDRRIAPVIHRAWHDYLSTHPTSCLDLHLQRAMSQQRRDEVCRSLSWLLRRIIGVSQ